MVEKNTDFISYRIWKQKYGTTMLKSISACVKQKTMKIRVVKIHVILVLRSKKNYII